MTLGEKLYHLRVSNNMTQEQLADRLHISRQSISKWESGQSRPDLQKLKDLAGMYGASLDDLLSDDLCNTLTSAENPAKETQDTSAVAVNDANGTAGSDTDNQLHAEYEQLTKTVRSLKTSNVITSIACILLAGALIAQLFFFSARITAVQQKVDSLPGAYTYTAYTADDNDSDDPEQALFTEFKMDVSSADHQNHTAALHCSAVLRQFTDNTAITLRMHPYDSPTPVYTASMQYNTEACVYESELQLPVDQTTYELDATIDTDGQKTTVPMNSLSGFSILSLADWQPVVTADPAEVINQTWRGVLWLGTENVESSPLPQISDVELRILDSSGTELFRHHCTDDEVERLRQSSEQDMEEQGSLDIIYEIPEQNELNTQLVISWRNGLLGIQTEYTANLPVGGMLSETDGYFSVIDSDSEPPEIKVFY
ncbi:MAG: helix-turn-helix domain-containing protein [Eubacterium sp.]|nr:helix-turn-helix domain-containing protein [Eubacterium sp.]